MPPKRKKQQPRNALYHFANTEVRRQLREEGRLAVSIQELIRIAHPRFQLLSEDEQDQWKAIAKEERLKLRADTENIFTSYGDSVADINRERENMARSAKIMKDDIEITVQNLHRLGTLVKEKIYLLDFNIFVHIKEPEQYIPAEVCVAKISLEKGVESIFQTIIIQKSIPLGYMNEARETSESTHRVPVLDSAKEPDYSGLICRLKSFINPNEEKPEYPPFYVMPENMDKCFCILQWMYERSLDQKRFPFKVYDLSYLLHTIRFHNPLGKHPGFLSMSEDLLQRPHFDYALGIECDWHRDMADEDKEVETIYCIQSKVTSKAYLFLDGCIGFYGIEPIANKHCPEASKTKAHIQVPLSSVDQRNGIHDRSKNRLSSTNSSSRCSNEIKSEEYGISQHRFSWRYEDGLSEGTASINDGNSQRDFWEDEHKFSPVSAISSSSRPLSRNCVPKKQCTGRFSEWSQNSQGDALVGGSSRSYASSESGNSSKYYTASEYDTMSIGSSVYYNAFQHGTEPFEEPHESPDPSRKESKTLLNDVHSTVFSNSVLKKHSKENVNASETSLRTWKALIPEDSSGKTGCSSLIVSDVCGSSTDIKDSWTNRLVDDTCGSSNGDKDNWISQLVDKCGSRREKHVLLPKTQSRLQQMHGKSDEAVTCAPSSSSLESVPPGFSQLLDTQPGEEVGGPTDYNSMNVTSFISKPVKGADVPPPGFENICPVAKSEERPKPEFIPPVKALCVQSTPRSRIGLGRGRGMKKLLDIEEQLLELKELSVNGLGKGRAKPALGF